MQVELLTQFITTTTQIHNGKCFFVGMVLENGKGAKAYNIESGGTGAAGNQVGYIHEDSGNEILMLPPPGVKCTNGLNVAPSGDCQVYYYL